MLNCYFTTIPGIVSPKVDMNITVEGGMNTDVTGMMLKAEGKTMADFKGGVKTTLTGGVVMIKIIRYRIIDNTPV